MDVLIKIRDWSWGVPTLTWILGSGIYLTCLTGGVQIRMLPLAFREFYQKLKQKPTGLRELCTALAATVGTGNIIGVAGAICVGGPGAIFWMWISAFLGMAVKFGEVTLALCFRRKVAGEYRGGPMYAIQWGMGGQFRFLAICYSAFGVLACLGMGTSAQISAVVESLRGSLEGFEIPFSGDLGILLGIGLAGITGYVMVGGGKRIGRMAEMLVPAASVIYVLLCAGMLIFRAKALPNAFRMIFAGVFRPRAITGGMVGSSFATLRVGCSRGIFSNEAGMGTAAIAHASAEVRTPAEQGRMGLMEVFLDTMVICTMTALAILTSGVPIPYGREDGGFLTGAALASLYGKWSGPVLSGCIALFAFATVLGWGLYGLRCWEFFFHGKYKKLFLFLQLLAIVLTGFVQGETVWVFSEIVNAWMAIPNLIALAALSPVLKRECK